MKARIVEAYVESGLLFDCAHPHVVLGRHEETAELGGQVLQVGVGQWSIPAPMSDAGSRKKQARSQERNRNKDNKVESRKTGTGKNSTHIKNARH